LLAKVIELVISKKVTGCVSLE